MICSIPYQAQYTIMVPNTQSIKKCNEVVKTSIKRLSIWTNQLNKLFKINKSDAIDVQKDRTEVRNAIKSLTFS